MGDLIDGCLLVICIKDGGLNWEKLSCEKLLFVEEGEVVFVVSNFNIVLVGMNVWIVLGGKCVRVFYSLDCGDSWLVVDSLIVEGD